MKATHRVTNRNHNTVGFIIENKYIKYYDALRNIELIDNLDVSEDNVIQPKNSKLEEISVYEINKKIYDEKMQSNPLLRDVQSELERWKTKWSNMVLYLTGARQIGKTTELLKFAYKNYDQIIYINLSQEASLKTFEELVISNTPNFGMIHYCRKMAMEEFENSPDTLIILDEIQESYVVYNSIRTLQESLDCHIAVTGSYLGKVLNAKYFKPAGNVYEIEMLPLSFAEFCRAFDKERDLLDIDLYGRGEREVYRQLTELYKVYRQIGGYPSVVTEYIKTRCVEDCFEVIRSIINRFTEESASYFEDDKCSVIFQNVYKAAFLSMTKEKKGTASKEIRDITDFVKTDTKEHVSRGEVNKAISWLKYSKIIGSCDLYNQGDVTDLLSERRFYFMDCGIANYVAQTTAMKNDAIEGCLTENFAYTELYRLYKTNRVKGDVPCCSVYQNYELDFMIVDKHDVKYGIEVKTSDSDNPKSLNAYLSNQLIDQAYLAGIIRGGIRERIKAIPVYTVGCRFPYD